MVAGGGTGRMGGVSEQYVVICGTHTLGGPGLEQVS